MVSDSVKRFAALAAALLLVFAVTLTVLGTPARAASVEPVFHPGNPSCADLGLTTLTKVDPPNSGTQDGGNSSDNSNQDGHNGDIV